MLHPCNHRLPTAWSGFPGAFLVAAGLGVIVSACSKEPTSPSPDAAPDVAAAATSALTFVQLSAGDSHTCGVTDGGRAYCWGDNSEGQLGDGTTDLRTAPVAVRGGLRFLAVSGGNTYTCGVTTDSKAYCWGRNSFGKLGDGTGVRRLMPVPVVGNLAFRQVNAGREHTCGVTTSYLAYCWGWNESGRLGIGTTFKARYRPTAVAGGLLFRLVTSGANHSCGIRLNGRGYCWGDNGSGQLGDGTTIDRLTPRAIPTLLFSQLVAGPLDRFSTTHSCGITTENKAYCWGANGDGQLGIGTRTRALQPRLVSGGLSFSGVSPGADHTCGITPGKKAYCWGFDYFGQLGNGGELGDNAPDQLTPSPMGSGLLFKTVSAGRVHTCGITTAGKAYCAGSGGGLGNGTTDPSSSPVAVIGPE